MRVGLWDDNYLGSWRVVVVPVWGEYGIICVYSAIGEIS